MVEPWAKTWISILEGYLLSFYLGLKTTVRLVNFVVGNSSYQPMIFSNRQEAAHLLAQELTAYAPSDAVVLALPRGGVPLGSILAQDLNLPLDIILIKKMGYPTQPEYAVGAVSLHSRIINPNINLPEAYVEEQTEEIRYQLRKRYERYRQASKPLAVKDKAVILVDDGMATGYTMLAAVQLLRKANPSQIILAVPVAAPRALDKIWPYVDDIVCLQAPEQFHSVGQFYQDFSEVSHEEVVQLLANSPLPTNNNNLTRMVPSYSVQEEVKIPINQANLFGNLHIPPDARGMIIFAHGSGSSRHSSRNKYIARVLEEAGFGTFLFDLLTEQEDAIYQNRFDIALLTQRLTYVTQWLQNRENSSDLPLGYFGSSTGSAAALGAAANLKDSIKAVVSRGGRPDLALSDLPRMTAATLLLVGSLDTTVIALNGQAYAALAATRKLTIVPGASHLFEEPGKLEEVAQLARKWFVTYLK